jgi:hypothetical protein
MTLTSARSERQGNTLVEICKALNRSGYRSRMGMRWRHPQQIVKLLRSFGGSR